MQEITLHDKTFVPFISGATLDSAIKAMADKIYAQHQDTIPMFIGVLNGSIMIMSDLMKHYKGNCEISFVKISSYEGLTSTNNIKEILGVIVDIKDRDVIVIEDIVDTGNTIVALKEMMEKHQPKSVKFASLFLKPEAYKKQVVIDYVGMEIPNKFIVGFGLDYDELGRNLPDVYQLK